MDWIEVLVSTISAIGLLAGSVALYRSNVKTKTIEARGAPYDDLADRVVELEKLDGDKHKMIQALRADLNDRDEVIEVMARELRSVKAESAHQAEIISAMARFIDEFGTWLREDQKGRTPRPSRKLHDYITVKLWDPDDPDSFRNRLRRT